MAISSGDGSIVLSTKVDTSGINKGMSSIKSIVGRIGTMIGVAFGVRALVNFGKAAINLASDLQEVQNVVDVAFGNMSYKVEEFAKSSIKNFGISELTAKRTASTYMAMAKGMGIVDDVASDMAITMTGLTADIASFYNMSQERADVILKSVYTGETETLKQLGIVMTEVNLENFAMSKGITKNLSAMTQQEKTMLRYQFVLEQTRLAQGDFARTQYSWANQTRILTERWKEMQRIFGEAFIMISTLVLPAINTLIGGLVKVAEFAKWAASNVYELFTGEKFNKQEESTNQTAVNIQKQTEAQKQLNKEMKKSLAGFDDLQILTSQSAGNAEEMASASFGSAVGGTATTSSEANTSKYQEIASAIKSTIADILDAANKALLALGVIAIFSGNIPLGLGLIIASQVAKVGGDTLESDNPLETLKTNLAKIEEQVIPALLGIGVLMLFLGAIPLGIGLILGGIAYWGYKEVQSEEYNTASFETKLNIIMEAVSLGLVAIGVMLIFFGQIPLGIGLIIAGKELLKATEAKLEEGGVTTKIQKFIDDNSGLIVGVGIALVVIAMILFACGIFSSLSLGILIAGGAVLATAEEIKPGAAKEEIQKFLDNNSGLIVGISTALLVIGILLCVCGVITPLSIGMIVAGAAGLVAEIALNWDAIMDGIKSAFETAKEWLSKYGGLIIGILLLFTGIGAPLGMALIMDAVSAMGTKEKPLLWNSILDSIKQTWSDIKSYWNENIADIWTLKFWLGLAKIAGNGLIDGFELCVNGIISMFESMINWIVDGLNKLSFENPLTGETIGVNISKVSLKRISIPRLAQGAVIPPNREFLAVLGDQKHGTNIEAPLDTIVEAFNIALSKNGGASGNNTIVLEVDGREFGRAVIEQGNRENRRIGTRLVMV